jgi:Zn finger protein HypA/HybF involved in hydrogenase expression
VSLKDGADAVAFLSILAGFFMFPLGVFSASSFMLYLSDGEISFDMITIPCLVMSGLFLIASLALTFPVAKVVLNLEMPGARRAAYFCLLFPVVLVSFLVATPQASFAPSLTFAFPLLLVGTIAYPYSALTMRKSVRTAEMENLLMVECFRCTYVFEMHREEQWIRCPYCGQVNLNPTKGEETDARAEEAQPLKPVSP